MNFPIDWAKKIWGVGSPKGFRVASWAVAIGAFGVWYYFDNKPTITDHSSISKKETKA